MEKARLSELIKKFKSGVISDEELQVLKKYVSSADAETSLDEYAKEKADMMPVINEQHKDHVFSEIWMNLNENSPIVPIKRNKTWLKIVSASAAAAVLIFGFFFLYLQQEGTENADLLAGNNEVPILPGGAKAKLLLEDGRTIELESIQNDTLINFEGYSIRKGKNGDLTYTITNQSAASKPLYNTIITPKGGEYKLNLPEGTSIWVNASSKLRYPLRFSDEKREVELTGEAYFEVAKVIKDGKRVPFFVFTNQQTLEVLGTSFNINSFNKNIETTLVEGKVKLSYLNGPEKILAPNQQALYHAESNKLQIEQIDPFYFTAWKNGTFAFERSPLRQVMEVLSRWYDVEVSYYTDVSKLEFTGTISKYEQIHKILRVIELTEAVKFKIEGRRIKVM